MMTEVIEQVIGCDARRTRGDRAAGRLVRGWWGLLPEVPLPGAPEAGVRLYHLGRLVGAPEWFAHPTPAAHPALNRLVGEVELPHVPVTMNKADVDRGSEVWAAVEARLHGLLAPAVRRLTREPASAVTPEAARTAEQVRRILAKALRLLEEGRLFESWRSPSAATSPAASSRSKESGNRPTRRKDGVPPRRPASIKMPPERPSRRPAFRARGQAAARGRSVAARGRGRRRRLDPRLRSALVDEDGTAAW